MLKVLPNGLSKWWSCSLSHWPWMLFTSGLPIQHTWCCLITGFTSVSSKPMGLSVIFMHLLATSIPSVGNYSLKYSSFLFWAAEYQMCALQLFPPIFGLLCYSFSSLLGSRMNQGAHPPFSSLGESCTIGSLSSLMVWRTSLQRSPEPGASFVISFINVVLCG